MLNKYKILNAIQEGIKTGFKFSSNSAIDDSSSIDFSDSKINNVESFNIRKIEEQDFVDLGLSVKWAKCNIGATCQDTLESWFGDYYAWGELKPKCIYSRDAYNLTLYKKYNKDNFHILLPEDDIVTLTYYGIDKFRMPTEKEIKELIHDTNIKIEKKIDYQGIEGLNGREFISKITGNSIFIPAASDYDGSTRYGKSDSCSMWSSSLHIDTDSNNLYNALDFYFRLNNPFIIADIRYDGMSIRGVCQ